MSEKRKFDASPESDQSQLYPRKRIAIACNVCRFRKTRCDAVKPSCGFCTDLGIECTYRKPTVGDRTKPVDPPSEAFASIERRLEQLEAKLESTQQLVHNSAMLSPSNHSDINPTQRPQSRHSSMHSSTANLIKNFTISAPSVGSPVAYDFAYRQTSTEGTTPRPSLTTFRAPSYIHVESWDYTAEFYDNEILAGEQLADQCDESVNHPIDLSRRMCRRLQQSFVQNFLRWTPIFDQQTCISALEQAETSRFAYSTAPVCLVYMILALGAISDDLNESPNNLTPGLDYFARGSQILESLSLRTGSLTTLQCRILQASYFKFAIRPLQTWNSITQAGRDCMHILSSKALRRFNPSEQEAFNRAFWACSTLLHELEATSKMHPIGLRHFHELVPLPQFEEEDSGFYFFLAQISLRKFLTQTLEVVGYLTGRVIFAPVVIGELRKQIQEWHDHLPSVVRFPLDATPLFDSRKSFLRGQYIALHVVLGWPSVLKILQDSESDVTMQDQDTRRVTTDHAQSCLSSSALVLSIAEEQLMGRKIGTHFTIYATFACFATLLIVFNHPALAFAEETRQEQHIRNGYEVLRPWAHLPFVRRALERARILMQQAGLAHIFHAHADESPPALAGISPEVVPSHDWTSPHGTK
ncbi:uncharacterized protein K460DRAFT_408837 [Cucurbitaria berberidis CBS 394.84]|uniref:Zn(2)-C6 fungal-type domain-containing protein n=1 Tax=Cucurbitaria berberidis CBS 394.84 TaxID=1168544 RepID=A0A9P4L4D7_9PLEO|nr:uncharacterized protein K460DRAFT_408837 [Cucurbitaria berberidis CBS 394.84]KAF1841370.1 hypothetical protein K460DRAFT_408837 [Cucurbitaria berberidis CBS 394.84]